MTPQTRTAFFGTSQGSGAGGFREGALGVGASASQRPWWACQGRLGVRRGMQEEVGAQGWQWGAVCRRAIGVSGKCGVPSAQAAVRLVVVLTAG